MWCVTTASVSIILNGSPSTPVQSEKGLGQGDHISSYLFIIVDESLNFIINEAINKVLIAGVHIG